MNKSVPPKDTNKKVDEVWDVLQKKSASNWGRKKLSEKQRGWFYKKNKFIKESFKEGKYIYTKKMMLK